jgi:hypothetical protein
MEMSCLALCRLVAAIIVFRKIGLPENIEPLAKPWFTPAPLHSAVRVWRGKTYAYCAIATSPYA